MKNLRPETEGRIDEVICGKFILIVILAFLSHNLHRLPAYLFQQNSFVVLDSLCRFIIKMSDGVKRYIFIKIDFEFFRKNRIQIFKISKFVFYTNRKTDG